MNGPEVVVYNSWILFIADYGYLDQAERVSSFNIDQTKGRNRLQSCSGELISKDIGRGT